MLPRSISRFALILTGTALAGLALTGCNLADAAPPSRSEAFPFTLPQAA